MNSKGTYLSAVAVLTLSSEKLSANAFTGQRLFATRAVSAVPNLPVSRTDYTGNPRRRLVLRTTSLQSEDQMLHTAERLAGMSRWEIAHIFDDIDMDSSGSIDLAELGLLAEYFGDVSGWTSEKKKKLMADMDTDSNGYIDSDEFYQWMVLNASNSGTVDEIGTKALAARKERLDLSKESVPSHLLELLDEIGAGAVVQKVTHPLHSSFGRTLRDHFISCYILAKQWGNSEPVWDAALFHAVYQRGDGMRAVDFAEFRPYLQEKIGKEAEELIYLFPSSHKSALLEDGLLMADVGDDIQVPNVLEGGMVTIPKELRPALVELEVINSHDQHVLENSSPVHNLWLFYQHAVVLSLMSEGARKSIIEYKTRAAGATCADVVAWHEARFKNVDKEIPEVWQTHLDLFRKGGMFSCAEDKLLELGDKDGNGEIDWDEFMAFDFDTCFF